MKAIIIDDEPLARTHIKEELKPWKHLITAIYEASNGKEAVKMIDEIKPEVIFLDIQMPAMNGFEVLRKIHHKPHVIFVTAYDKYAIQAFEANAIDYLMKPVSSERLAQALQKLEKWKTGEDYQNKIEQLLSYLNNSNKPIDRLKVRANDLIYFIELKDVFYFHSENKITVAHCKNGKHVVDYSLNAIEEKVSPDTFIRISRADLINLNYLKEVRRWFNGKYVAILKPLPDVYLEISRRRIKDLMNKF